MTSKPDWLFTTLIIVSVAVHSVIFVHLTALYRKKNLSFIELTLNDITKPPTRSIPRPPRKESAPPPKTITHPNPAAKPIPQLKPMKLEPAQAELPDTLVERIASPEITPAPGVSLSAWQPPDLPAEIDEFDTSSSYLEMVRARIESNKKYPDLAQRRQVEGAVTLRFTITPEGEITDLMVAKSSRHQALDKAACDAVTASVPFPKPPKRFFKGEVSLEVTVVFELT